MPAKRRAEQHRAATERASNKRAGTERARPQAAGASKEGTHWWIAGIHWIARHRLDNYEDRALMSPWPKPKNSTGQEGARFETPAARHRTHVGCRGRGEARKRQAAGGKQKRGHKAKPAGGRHQPAKAPKLSQHKVDPTLHLGGRDQNQQRKQTVEADERYSTPHCCTVAPHRQSGRDDDHARNKQAGDQCPTNTGQRARSRVTKRRSTHTAHIAQEK